MRIKKKKMNIRTINKTTVGNVYILSRINIDTICIQ